MTQSGRKRLAGWPLGGSTVQPQSLNGMPGLVETVTIPMRAIAMQTSSGYGVAIAHPWESWAEVFWFRDRDHFTEAFQESWYDQKAGRGSCALQSALRREAFKSEQVAVNELIKRSGGRP